MDILARIFLLTAVFLFTGCGLGTMQDVENTQSVLEHAQTQYSKKKKEARATTEYPSLETEYPYGPGLKMSCVKQDIVCQPWSISRTVRLFLMMVLRWCFV